MYYICLVCGYDKLKEKIFDGQKFYSTNEICPSCGFHYGYDDLNGTGEYPESFSEKDIIKAFRLKWISKGSKWWSKNNNPPKNWDIDEQITNIPEEFK